MPSENNQTGNEIREPNLTEVDPSREEKLPGKPQASIERMPGADEKLPGTQPPAENPNMRR